MRILLDTNIIIPLEDSATILDESFSQLIKLANTNSHIILIHPRSVEDIQRDKDEIRRSSMLSRVQKYKMLEDAHTFSDEQLLQFDLTKNKENDDVDNTILAAVHFNAVHLLVTEDRGIHKKAAKLGIADSVLYLQQIVDVLARLHPLEEQIFHPNLQDVSLHQLNLENTFFDSLREDYNGFDNWFKQSARNGRKAWVNKDSSSSEQINAILIYKQEENEIITVDNKALPRKSIKISTFKVDEKVRGKKLGELLFKTIFEYAFKNSISWIYLTIHPSKHIFLKDLCHDLGFYKFGVDIKSERDEVYIKQVGMQDSQPSPLSAFSFYRKYSPAILCNGTAKYVIPIQQMYHEILFPDNQSQMSLFANENAPGNTIKKAYLSHAQIKNIKAGDLVLFYRSGDAKKLTTLAIVEDYFVSQDAEYIASRVAKRTVYSYEDIKRMSEKKTKVILFRQIKHFTNRIDFTWMLQNNIVNGNIQSIQHISDKSFDLIMEKENATNCITVN